MINLDLKDRKILYELDLNSRRSFNEIAKKVGLSKDSVIYRIENLKKEGIIQRYHTIIDTSKLGFISFRLYLKFQNTTENREQEIINWLKAQKNITWLVSMEGEYDLGMWILVQNTGEMGIFWKNLLRKYGNYIESRFLTIFNKVSYFPKVFLLDKKDNSDAFVFISDSKTDAIDEKDWKILRLLAEDARISIVDLSGKLKMTPKTILKRMRILEERKIILGYKTMFDLEKIGYQYFKLFIRLHNLDGKKDLGIRNFIKKHPNIIYDNEVIGGDDIELDIQVKSLEDLRIIIAEIKKNFSNIVKDYKYYLFYKEHKHLFLPVKI